MYLQYTALLGPSKKKEELNKLCRSVIPTFDQVMEYEKDNRIFSSPDAISALERIVLLNLKQIGSTKNLFPTVYARKGKPRLYAFPTRGALSGVKVGIKLMALRRLNETLKGEKILSIDIKSCFMGILQGLFPLETSNLTKSLKEQGSVWNFIRDDFEKRGFAGLYQKPLAKVCLYATFFSGGLLAYQNAILRFRTQELGITMKDLIKMESFHKTCVEESATFSKGFKEGSLPVLLKNISRNVMQSHKGKILHGPCGYRAMVRKEDFRSTYSLYFQSHEVSIIMASMLALKEAFPQMEVLLHQHDGVSVIIPSDIEDAFRLKAKHIIKEVCAELKLKSEMEFDIEAY